jgi:hypothetical protein
MTNTSRFLLILALASACDAPPEHVSETTSELRAVHVAVHNDEAIGFQKVYDFAFDNIRDEATAMFLDEELTPIDDAELARAAKSGVLRGHAIDRLRILESSGSGLLLLNNRRPDRRLRAEKLIVHADALAEVATFARGDRVTLSARHADGSMTSVLVELDSVRSF